MYRSVLWTMLLALKASYLMAQSSTDLFEEAKKYYENDRYREALNLLDKFIVLDSTVAEAFKMRGNCNYEINRMDMAISDYKMAIQLDSTMSFALYNLANVYEHREIYDSAILYFRKYVSLEGSDPDGFVRLGFALRTQDQVDTAMALYQQAFRLDSTHFSAIYYLAQEYMIQGEFEKVREFAGRGSRLDSLDISFYLLGAAGSRQLGDFKNAIALSDRALKLDSTNYEAIVLNLESTVLSKMSPESYFTTKTNEYKFENLNSNNLLTVLEQDSLGTHAGLLNQFKDGLVLPLDHYFKFYISQRLIDGFSPYSRSSTPKIKEHWTNEEFEALSEYDEQILNSVPINLTELYQVSVAKYVTGDLRSFKKLYAIYLGLMNGIMASGDGESYETAYVVISTSDEYALLNYMGLRSSMQSLQSSGGHSFDVLRSVDSDGVEKDIYFNIDIPFGHLSSSFSKDKKKKKRKKK